MLGKKPRIGIKKSSGRCDDRDVHYSVYVIGFLSECGMTDQKPAEKDGYQQSVKHYFLYFAFPRS
jgi:hypothetical protein